MPFADEFFLVGRLIFGLVLAYTSINHFTATDYMAQYAEAKGVPAPKAGVIVSGIVLLLGGLAIVVWAFPVVAAALLAIFLVVSAVMVHNYWAVPEDQRDDEQTAFLKNIGLTGGALVFLSLGGLTVAYGLNVGLFI
ncbi:terminal quinol oxidase subunit [Halarchaeum acidiphilum MH1-52-1]|uniref:Terminal quinol oxidase subunit n=1 Tax=Halarchaeum acidiphilum MH1-52-1 TaxID=1261545 RepID=U3AAZ3_9EURY|nr:terminal quinol oxidase subunit [Halarchaeum acidiphilum MH1-52-1]